LVKDQSKTAKSSHQLKEADQIIEELTSTLQRRESEMQLALDENDKLMQRYRILENELRLSYESNLQLRGHFTEEMENAELRIKLTQDQAMNQLKQMRETHANRSQTKLSQSMVLKENPLFSSGAADGHVRNLASRNLNLNQTFTQSTKDPISASATKQKSGGLSKGLKFNHSPSRKGLKAGGKSVPPCSAKKAALKDCN